MSSVKTATKPGNKGPRKKQPEKELSFFSFLKQKAQLIDLGIFSGILILLYIGLSYCYPTPNTTPDTFNYFLCYNIDDFGGYRPVGYSWFLGFADKFVNKLNGITGMQYILHSFAVLYLVFTAKYFMRSAGRLIYYVFALIVLGDVTILYLTKWLISDSVYTSLSFIWFTSLIWLLHNYKAWFTLAIHIIVLFLVMKTRYAGLVYPLVTTAAFIWIHRLKGWYVPLVSLAVLGIVYNQGVKDNKRIFKADTFSAFSGWAKANNAASVLPYVEIDSTKLEDPEVKRINRILTQAPDSFYTRERIFATSFMWNKDYPGKKYMVDLRQRNMNWTYVINWVHTGVNLNKYANAVIAQHPVEYAKQFLLPNTANFLFPADDIPAFADSVKVDKVLTEKFEAGFDVFLSKFDVYHHFFDSFGLRKYNVLFIIALLMGLLAIVLRKRMALEIMEKRILALIVIFLGLYGAFLVVAHPILLRYVTYLCVFFSLFIVIIINGILKGRKNHQVNDKI